MDEEGKNISLKLSDFYRNFLNNPTASTIYDAINTGLYIAAPFTGGLTAIPAGVMTATSAGLAANDLYLKGLTIDNGLDLVGAIPGSKVVKGFMKPTMNAVGKSTKVVKKAPLFKTIKETNPVSITKRELVSKHGGRRVYRDVEHTFDLGKTRKPLWKLASDDFRYAPYAFQVYGWGLANIGINGALIINDVN